MDHRRRRHTRAACSNTSAPTLPPLQPIQTLKRRCASPPTRRRGPSRGGTRTAPRHHRQQQGLAQRRPAAATSNNGQPPPPLKALRALDRCRTWPTAPPPPQRSRGTGFANSSAPTDGKAPNAPRWNQPPTSPPTRVNAARAHTPAAGLVLADMELGTSNRIMQQPPFPHQPPLTFLTDQTGYTRPTSKTLNRTGFCSDFVSCADWFPVGL